MSNLNQDIKVNDPETQLIERLQSLRSLTNIPYKELTWLVEHGQLQIFDAGNVVASKGTPIDFLYIILSGHMSIKLDRGVGPRLVTEWQAGDINGKLPYSRMTNTPGDVYLEERAEVLKIKVQDFPAMIQNCPDFTAHTVHSMLDRARTFNSSALQDEKMVSLGKLAAGLAHELNNPASAMIRDAKLLTEILTSVVDNSGSLVSAGFTNDQLNVVIQIQTRLLTQQSGNPMSPIDKADYQDKICQWLIQNRIEPELAESLADSSISISDLDKIKESISKQKINIVLKWLITNYTANMLALEMQQASGQIYRLVDAVKKFTYLDQKTEKEYVNIESAIGDTIQILSSKIKSKNAEINLNFDAKLPQVYANGSDLNQVWFSLIDNALDAIPSSGKIEIKAYTEHNHVIVKIIDNGPGIAPEIHSKIFDPFFTTKPTGQGTGLGLDIVRRLLRRYNGEINIHTKPGHTEFCVNLIHEATIPPKIKAGQQQ